MWRISVDTGGTFTDCLGISPEGDLKRVKVLSSGCLRGRVLKVISPERLIVKANWGLPDQFITGFAFRLLGKGSLEGMVKDFRGDDSLLTLAAPLLRSPGLEGRLFEVQSSDESPVLGARILTGTRAGQPLPPLSLRLGTTKGTNALLEEKGADVVLFLTEGLRDLLQIGDQKRPDLFQLDIRKPKPISAAVVEVRERIGFDGTVVLPLDRDHLRSEFEKLPSGRFRVAAVALLHSYNNPLHEGEVKAFLKENGFNHVVCSSEVAPFIKYLSRSETTLVDAYLGPLMSGYLKTVEKAVRKGRFSIMTSAGGLVSRERYRPKDSLLSGPAGGVVGAVSAGKRAGLEKLLAFDMGGTSTDVSRFEEEFEYRESHRVGRARLLSPALRIETVAAGGGSVCGFDGETLFVGPQSAGAFPGPACYGAGGPLTLTDVNLLLGRLDTENLGIPVLPGEALARVEELLPRLFASRSKKTGKEALLEGFLDLANERMADAIRKISVREGYDPAEYAIVAFGGAGGMHVCGVADKLGVSRILFPNEAGLLSARGLSRAQVESFAEKQVLLSLQDCAGNLDREMKELEEKALGKLRREGIARDSLTVRVRTLQVRLAGQESALTCRFESASRVADIFAERYRSVFGYVPVGKPIEVVSGRVLASTRQGKIDREKFPRSGSILEGERTLSSFVGGKWRSVPAYQEADLAPGTLIAGPAIITDPFSTLNVDSGWKARRGDRGSVLLSRVELKKRGGEKRAGIVERELFTQRFRNIVEEMGLQLQRTALSTNIKERFDFSCGLLDADGYLIVNAPHIPVHLGALGLCVREVAKRVNWEPGDVVITNHPACGGSHLPDLTLITPVFESSQLLGFVANRAHHAEIGGIKPGSMAPEATVLLQEGVVIPPMKLFSKGSERFEVLTRLLRESRYPSRAVEDNLADIKAQVAANIRGEEAFKGLIESYGRETIQRHLSDLKRYAAEAMKKRLSNLPAGRFKAEKTFDDGTLIAISLTLRKGGVKIDFSGSSGRHPGNLNATPAIVRSAVVYVLRLLIQEDIPLNEGLMEPVRIVLPEGFLNPAFGSDATMAPAVAGGNVETSQNIVEALLLPLNLVAGSQGTMNNLVFGNEAFSYYETIGGGAGAGPGFDGADAVHTHMTNTAITDAEILEYRYPVRLRRFQIRENSGGAGEFKGGNGIRREIEFIDEASLSLLTQHRKKGPCGRAGGAPGKPGRQWLIRADGESVLLKGTAHEKAYPGDRLVIETPGGGGWGKGKE